MWSAAVFEPALPGRSSPASSSLVLSHHTPIGWNPKFLERGRGLLLLAVRDTIVASTSSTTTSPRSVPATFEAGRPPRGEQRPHVAADPRPGRLDPSQPAGVSSSSARHTVGGDATGPSTWPLVAQHVDVGDRLTTVGEHHRHVDQHPAPVMDRGERAPRQRLDSSPVRPARSASSRTATLPRGPPRRSRRR